MRVAQMLLMSALLAATLSGCLKDDTADGPGPVTTPDDGFIDLPMSANGSFERRVLPAVFQGHGLYEPTIDVSPDGAIYYSAHSQNVGENPAPAFYSLDDGLTWMSMAFVDDSQAEPEEAGAAPVLSDEIFIVAGEGGQAWGMDCCTKAAATTGQVPVVGGLAGLAPTGEVPLVGWCRDGAEVCYYNENAMDHSSFATDASQDCVPFYGTDRPWVAYANNKLLLVNNPGTSLSAIAGTGPTTGPIPLQVGAMDVPPLTPYAYDAAAWGIEWNLCGSSGGFIPGIPDMRDDHFFAVPQWVDYGACKDTHYDVITGNADDVNALTQTTVFHNSHVAPAEDDSVPSNIGMYGQTVFDADGALYLGAMNNTDTMDGDTCVAEHGGLHFAVSTDDAATFTETTFRFERPVSAFYMDGNRYGPGFLVTWGLIDGNNTDWYAAHVFINADGTLRLDNVMLAVDDGPEASRHVQGSALGPDGRAYLALSRNSSNPGGATVQQGDTPLEVAVQLSGATMPVDE